MSKSDIEKEYGFLPEECTGNCNLSKNKKIAGGFLCNMCEDCLFIFEWDKDSKKEKENKIKKQQKTKEKKERQYDKNITDLSREQKSQKYKSNVDIKSEFSVKRIPTTRTHEWLTYKHYARRVPPISLAFGLFNKIGTMVGVVTYGPPARHLNDGYGVFGGELKVQTYELNRLCVDNNLPTNCLSYFVSESLNMLVEKKQEEYFDNRNNLRIRQITIPVCVVSYADSNNNHHGYIYQATNWIYTGETEPLKIFVDKNTGKPVHARTIVSRYGSSAEENLPSNISIEEESGGKFRYFKFLGDKKQVKLMKDKLTYKIEDYPKGKNDRYDSSHETAKQLDLFGGEI